MILALNDRLFGQPREFVCLGIALALHAPLFFWKARPYSGPLGDPIAEIEFRVEQEEAPAPVEKPKPPEQKSFFTRIKEKVGIATPKPVRIPAIEKKPEPQLAGAPEPNRIVSLAKNNAAPGGERLTDKSKPLSGGFGANQIKTGGATGASLALGAGGADGGGTLKTKPTAFRVSSADLPMAVKQRSGGDLASSDPDAPLIAMANKSDKGIKKVSEAFFGSGGGAGGGSGSGAGGGGLKDKSMEGMAGVSGGFGTGTIDPSSVGGGSGRGALQAGGGGSGGGSGAGGRAPYEITGALSGRKIMHQVLPPYPEWAREKGLFALVSIEFSVFHNGQVNVSSMLVKKSSGYIQLDTLVQEALAKWRFEPLDASQYGKEQKGTITFKFRAI